MFGLSLTGCGGGGGGAISIPAPQVNNVVLSGINNLTGSSGNFNSTLASFKSDEEAILLTFSKSTVNTNFSYSIQGTNTVVGAPAKSVNKSSASYSPAPVDNKDYRMRSLEKLTALTSKMVSPGKSKSPLKNINRAVHTVGEVAQIWSLNSLRWPPSASDWTLVNATCKAVGTHCYLFMDNDISAGSSYTTYPDEAWAEIQSAFDNTIYPNNTSTFGSEPLPPNDVDNDAKIYILFTPNVNKQNASGYFDSTNELTQVQASQISGGGTYYSNEKEIMYMQVPTTSWNWSQENFRVHILGVMAHEFLHMIVYNQHVMLGGNATNEEDWLNEGLAQVAQDLNGYGYQHGELSFVIQPFLSSTGSYTLTNFYFNLGQYGMSYLFVRYLADQGYNLKQLVSTTNRGITNVNTVTGKDFNELYQNWVIALYLSNTGASTDPKYNYTTLNLRSTQKDGTVFNGPSFTATETSFPFTSAGNVKGYGIEFTKITGGNSGDATLKITDTGGGNLGVTVLRTKTK